MCHPAACLRCRETRCHVTADVAADEFLNGDARFSWEMPMPGEIDNMPAALMMPGGFGRAAARRMLYRPAGATAAAGVWDDSEPGDAAHDPMNGSKHHSHDEQHGHSQRMQ